MAAAAPQIPPTLKVITPYIRIAAEHEAKNPVIAYWCRFYALEQGLKVNKGGDERAYLVGLMDRLEQMKAAHKEDDAFTNDVVAQSTIESHALKLFSWADQQDRNSKFDKSVIRAFHAAGYIFDILANFGELSEETQRMSRYAKWKAAYIHKCLKEGTQPIPGPLKGDDEGFEEDAAGPSGGPTPPQQPGGSNQASPDEGGAPTPMPRGLNAGGGAFDLPQVPLAPRDESTGAYPKVQPPPQQLAATPYYPPVPQPPQAMAPVMPPPAPGAVGTLTPDLMLKAQKYCKYANSAMTYDDVPTAVLNLQKALTLLTTGQDPQ